MNAQAALNSFWNGFGWTAWEENSVPENAFSRANQYITYSAGESGFNEPMMLSASLWQRSTNWKDVITKAQQIMNYIGMGGVFIATDEGAIWIKRGRPFAQRMSDEDPAVRRIYLNIEVEFITN
jgi:hypothetical protein